MGQSFPTCLAVRRGSGTGRDIAGCPSLTDSASAEGFPTKRRQAAVPEGEPAVKPPARAASGMPHPSGISRLAVAVPTGATFRASPSRAMPVSEFPIPSPIPSAGRMPPAEKLPYGAARHVPRRHAACPHVFQGLSPPGRHPVVRVPRSGQGIRNPLSPSLPRRRKPDAA